MNRKEKHKLLVDLNTTLWHAIAVVNSLKDKLQKLCDHKDINNNTLIKDNRCELCLKEIK